MFKKENGDEIETVIGPSVIVEGHFVARGDIIVEGVVSGSIKTERNLRVGGNAKIYADITAGNAFIAGEVQGDIKIKEALELAGTAKIFGDVKTKVLTIGAGATLQGKCIAGEDRKSKAEKIEEAEDKLENKQAATALKEK